jgi:hypothetical protein
MSGAANCSMRRCVKRPKTDEALTSLADVAANQQAVAAE